MLKLFHIKNASCLKKKRKKKKEICDQSSGTRVPDTIYHTSFNWKSHRLD